MQSTRMNTPHGLFFSFNPLDKTDKLVLDFVSESVDFIELLFHCLIFLPSGIPLLRFAKSNIAGMIN